MKKKILFAALMLVIIQTTTYHLFSERQLSKELLPDYFNMHHKSDSAYVQNFYDIDCDVYPPNYVSHDLKKENSRLKKKLNVKFIYFPNKTDFNLNDSLRKKYNVIYSTWMVKYDGYNILKFYTLKQVEYLYIKETKLRREVDYQWFLFFWIKKFEFLQT